MTIPWPTRVNVPLSEFTTQNLFSISFPTVFPYGKGDISRSRTCTSMAAWADHIFWSEDVRFAKHPYFKFVVTNMLIIRMRALENSCYIVNQQIQRVKELRALIQFYTEHCAACSNKTQTARVYHNADSSPSKHEDLTQCCFNVGPAPLAVGQ